MLVLKIFTVFDAAAGSFNPPFPAPSAAAALRGFGDAANDGQSAIGQHPKDYTLFHVGEFDVLTGKISPVTPVGMENALTLVRQKEGGQ